MCPITIFTKGISDSKAGQAEAQHCNQSQYIHNLALLSIKQRHNSALMYSEGHNTTIAAYRYYGIPHCVTQPSAEGLPPTILATPIKILSYKQVNFNSFPIFFVFSFRKTLDPLTHYRTQNSIPLLKNLPYLTQIYSPAARNPTSSTICPNALS